MELRTRDPELREPGAAARSRGPLLRRAPRAASGSAGGGNARAGTCRVWLLVAIVALSGCGRRPTLAHALADHEFWSLIETLSEPAGAFAVSDNLVSNEPHVAENARWLRPGRGVYIGVGPEQNFSYIAAMRPRLAFIIDIRRENLALHLLYKALFELSADRADFVSRLFSRPTAADAGPEVDVDDLFRRLDRAAPSLERYNSTVARVREHLTLTHRFPLSSADLESIATALKAFYTDGPEIQFWGSRIVDANHPSYRALMTMRDLSGQTRSFLASAESFRVVRDLHMRNAIVPVVGDFGGPRAMRRVGDYVRTHRATVDAFYASNVAVYLTERQARAFCGNLASLPAASHAVFIESIGVRPLRAKLKGCAPDQR